MNSILYLGLVLYFGYGRANSFENPHRTSEFRCLCLPCIGSVKRNAVNPKELEQKPSSNEEKIKEKKRLYLFTKSRQDSCWPEDLSEKSWYEQQAAHSFAVLLLKRIDHGHVAGVSHSSSEQNAAKYEAKCIADWRLTPHQTGWEDHFGTAVDETTTYPSSYLFVC